MAKQTVKAVKKFQVAPGQGCLCPDGRTVMTAADGFFEASDVPSKVGKDTEAICKKWLKEGCLIEVLVEESEDEDSAPSKSKTSTKKLETKKIWTMDPKDLEGTDLDELNVIIQDLAKKAKVKDAPTCKSKEEAIQYLTQDR